MGVYVLTSHCNFKACVNVPHVNKTVTDFGGIYNTDIPPPVATHLNRTSREISEPTHGPPSLVIAVVVASLPRVVTETELLCCCNPVYVGQPKVHRHWLNAVVHP